MNLEQITRQVDVSNRVEFIRKTYSHLFVAVLAFIAFEFILFQSGIAAAIAPKMLSISWLIILGGFMIVGQLASYVAFNSMTLSSQYLALFTFVLAEALIFIPLLYVAQYQFGFGIIQEAASITILAFAGLTGLAWYTKKDFSFLGIFIKWISICALVLIVVAVLFGFDLGILFATGMVCLAGAAILYDTSNIIHHFNDERYVSAALQLFASVALMFWYVLTILMNRR